MSRRWLVPIAAVSFAACGLPEGDYFGFVPEPDPTHMRYCNSGEPEFLDPALVTSTTGLKIVYAMFAGLTDHNLEGLPEPSIAASWDVGPELKTFTFHLRDDAVWSATADGELDGRPITSEDFRYSMIRVLNPYTLSANAETLWKIENGELYYANRLRRVLAAAPPFRAGERVKIVGMDGKLEDNLGDMSFPDTNTRRGSAPLALRDYGKPASDAYETVPAGADVVIIELRGPPRSSIGGAAWAFVFSADARGGDGAYGWVPAAELDQQPYADVELIVKSVDDPDNYERSGIVRGRDLLMLPDDVGIETPDPHTVVIRTDNPVPYLIALSPQRAFRPTRREAVARRPKRWTDAEHISTSGAFHMKEWKRRDKIVLVKSPSYFEADTVKLDKITVYNNNDSGASANLYFQGSCDAVTSNNIPTSYLPALAGEKRGGRPYKDYHAAPYLGIYFYLIQTEKLDNVHLRRALNFAVDRTQLPKILKGGQTPTAQFTPGRPIGELSDEELALCGVTRDTPGVAMIMESDVLCYVPPPGLDFDLEKARDELALAKQQMGKDFPSSISLKYNSGVEGHKLIAEYLQYVWQTNLDLDIELASQEWKTFLKDTRDGNYQVARMGWIGNFPDTEAEFLPPFKCGSPDNRTKWCNREFMKMYDRMEATFDRKERIRILRDMEELMINEAPIIPLYVYTQHHLHKPYMRDLAINFTDQQPWSKTWIDPNWKRAARETDNEK